MNSLCQRLGNYFRIHFQYLKRRAKVEKNFRFGFQLFFTPFIQKHSNVKVYRRDNIFYSLILVR